MTVGHISIERDSNDVTVTWQDKPRTLDSWCLSTTLGGTDTEGDTWTITLSAFRPLLALQRSGGGQSLGASSASCCL